MLSIQSRGNGRRRNVVCTTMAQPILNHAEWRSGSAGEGETPFLPPLHLAHLAHLPNDFLSFESAGAIADSTSRSSKLNNFVNSNVPQRQMNSNDARAAPLRSPGSTKERGKAKNASEVLVKEKVRWMCVHFDGKISFAPRGNDKAIGRRAGENRRFTIFVEKMQKQQKRGWTLSRSTNQQWAHCH